MKKKLITSSQIKKAFEDKTPLHAKKQISVLPDWSDFINNINSAIKDDSYAKEPPLLNFERVNHVRFYDKLTIGIDHSNKYPYKGLPEIINFLKTLNLEPFVTMSLMNFADSQKTTSRHSDNCLIFYVQAVGSAKWCILVDDLEKEFVLEPGDVIFVPDGLMHEIVPLMPRAALSFAVKFIN
jgi:hypothetical protein